MTTLLVETEMDVRLDLSPLTIIRDVLQDELEEKEAELETNEITVATINFFDDPNISGVVLEIDCFINGVTQLFPCHRNGTHAVTSSDATGSDIDLDPLMAFVKSVQDEHESFNKLRVALKKWV